MISSAENQRAISRWADSGLSLPCTRLFCLLIEKSPRTVPGAAATPLVAPSMVRTTLIASFPSSTPTTTGPLVMNEIRPSKNGLPWCSA